MTNEPPFDEGSYPYEETAPPIEPQLGPGGPQIPVMQPRSRALPSRWDNWTPVLNNRILLSALSLVVVLLLVAIVLVAIGHGSSSAAPRSVVSVPSPGADATAVARGDVPGKILTTASVRNGPDPTFAILGTIPRGASVSAIGRSEDQTWIQIRYPPGSTLRGWVDSQFVKLNGDVELLVVAEPGPTPFVEVPTIEEVPTVAEPTAEEPFDTPTSIATETPTTIEQTTPTKPPIETPTETPVATKAPPGG